MPTDETDKSGRPPALRPDGLRQSRADDDEAAWADAHAREAEEQRAEEEEAERRLEAIDVMTEWFSTQFEDPQNETPYNDEGGYTYIWGGPFDAMEVLSDNFAGDYEEEWIRAAANEVEKDGTFEWAPSPRGDYYEHPEPEEGITAPRASQFRDEILVGIEELKARLAELPVRPNQIGHNQPPEEIGAPPYDEEDREQISELLDAASEEVRLPLPDPDRLSRIKVTLGEFAEKAVKYAATKADLAVDEGIKWGVPMGLGYLAFGEMLHRVIGSITRLFGY